jgi:dTMP kinase
MPKQKAKLIVIDGVDGSGKTTQWQILKRRFKKENIPYVSFDFPIYKSFFGKFIKRYLSGEFGDPTKFNPYYSSLPFAFDRFFHKEKLYNALNSGKHILANRYVTANMILQGAKILNKKEREKFFSWISDLEYHVLGLPQPDLVIYFWLPASISQKLIRERERKKEKRKIDGHERNLAFQARAVAVSRSLASRHKNWKMIECYKAGELLSREKIAEEVWKIVGRVLNEF